MLQPDVRVGAESAAASVSVSSLVGRRCCQEGGGGVPLICEGVQMGEGRLSLSWHVPSFIPSFLLLVCFASADEAGASSSVLFALYSLFCSHRLLLYHPLPPPPHLSVQQHCSPCHVFPLFLITLPSQAAALAHVAIQ